MFASVDQILSGGWPVGMLAHLAVGPVPEPYSVDAMTEASWSGYAPSGVSPVQRVTAPDEYQFMQATVTFGNFTDSAKSPTALWIDGYVGSVKTLVCVIPLPFRDYQGIPVGGITWDIVLTGFRYD